MIGLDRAAKEVHLGATFDDEGREITPPHSIPYDTLVIAIGSVTNDFWHTRRCRARGAAGDSGPGGALQSPLGQCLHSRRDAGRVQCVPASFTWRLSAPVRRAPNWLPSCTVPRARWSPMGSIASIRSANIRIVLIEGRRPHPAQSAGSDLRGAARSPARPHRHRGPYRREGDGSNSGRLAAGRLLVHRLGNWWCGRPASKAPDVLRHVDGLEVNRINQPRSSSRLWQTTRDLDIFAIGDLRRLSAPRRAHPGAAAGPSRTPGGRAYGEPDRAPPARRPASPLHIPRFSARWCRSAQHSTVGTLMGLFRPRLLHRGSLCRGHVPLTAHSA